MLELVVVEVGGAQRHDQVAEPDERGVGVREEAHHHVAVEHRHGGLVAVLWAGSGGTDVSNVRVQGPVLAPEVDQGGPHRPTLD